MKTFSITIQTGPKQTVFTVCGKSTKEVLQILLEAEKIGFNQVLRIKQVKNPLDSIPDDLINTDFDGIEEEHNPNR